MVRHTPSNISTLKKLNLAHSNNPSLIPDGSLLAVHRPLGIDPLTLNSWAIRKVTDSWGNHGAVKGMKNGEHVVWDSGAKGVMCYDWNSWVRYHWPKMWYVVPPFKKVNNEDWLKYELRPYDYAGVYIHHIWYAITGKWIGKEGIEASKKTYCNEFWCHEMGLPDAHKMTTADILDIVWNSGEFKRLNGL